MLVKALWLFTVISHPEHNFFTLISHSSQDLHTIFLYDLTKEVPGGSQRCGKSTAKVNAEETPIVH